MVEHRGVDQFIESYKLSKEDANWTKKWYLRGKLRYDTIANPSRFYETKLRHFVTKHELGHLKIAKRFGWRILEFVTNANGAALGWVKMSPPARMTREIVKQSAIISLGGNAATGSEWGCSSDFNQADGAMKFLDFSSKSALLDEAKAILPSDEVLDLQSWDYQQAA